MTIIRHLNVIIVNFLNFVNEKCGLFAQIMISIPDAKIQRAWSKYLLAYKNIHAQFLFVARLNKGKKYFKTEKKEFYEDRLCLVVEKRE